jgi:hypothetical protein
MPQPATLDMAVEVVAAFVSKNLRPAMVWRRRHAIGSTALAKPVATIQTRVSRTGAASPPLISSVMVAAN